MNAINCIEIRQLEGLSTGWIKGKEIPVSLIVHYLSRGKYPDEVIGEIPGLQVHELYQAMAWYSEQSSGSRSQDCQDSLQ